MKTIHPSSTLALFICLCLYSSCVFSTTLASEQAYMNRERASINHSNASFIQHVMVRLLSFFGAVLTSKALFFAIPIVMVCILYENDNTSLKSKSFNVCRERLPERNHSSQQQPAKSLQPNPFKKRAPSNIRQKVKSQQDRVTGNKESEQLQQQTSSNVSKKRVSEKNHTDQQQLLNGSLQQKPLKEENPFNYTTGSLVLSPLKKGEKSDTEKTSERINFQRSKIIYRNNPGTSVLVHRKGKPSVYRLLPCTEKDNEWNNLSTSKTVVLDNFIIPFQHGKQLWINPGFYTSSMAARLAVTCKDSYLQFKKLPGILGKESPDSYKFHPAHKICIIHPSVRRLLIQFPDMRDNYLQTLLFEAFETFYEYLINEVHKCRTMSYKSFKVFLIGLSENSAYEKAVKNFFTRKFLERREWTFEELQNSKDTLKQEFKQIIIEYTQSPEYDFTSQNQVNEASYGKILEKMKKIKAPFCDCPSISQLFVSSRGTPLKLLLFWDIFWALKMEILTSNNLMGSNRIPHLRNHLFIDVLGHSIIHIYRSQNKNYISNLWFELVDFIQRDFFKNSQRYEASQPEQQHRIAFDSYMLGIQDQVNTFLATELFINYSVVINAEDPQNSSSPQSEL